jgi:hypothetical protein
MIEVAAWETNLNAVIIINPFSKSITNLAEQRLFILKKRDTFLR